MSDGPDARAADLVERARRLFPWSGTWGSVMALAHGERAYPHFFERADGAFIVDAAGRAYLDWYSGGGPIALGHRHPEVQAALAAQLERGVNLSGPSALEIEVGERLVAMIPGAEQVEFAKNGTDVTSAAVRLARAVTGRDLVLVSGYHGFADWSKAALPDCAGIPAALRGTAHEFGFNDLDAARRLMEQHGRSVAAIVVEPVRYAQPARDFLPGLRELADRWGALLVLDEIVTGFRIARGGVQQALGVRADLVCLAKAIANGSPLSALTGPRRLMKHLPSTQFGLTWRRDALSLAAARATLDVHARVDVAGHLARIGEALRAGFDAAAARCGLAWHLYGHPAMLHLHFEGGGRLTTRGAETLFVERCQQAGLYLEPYRLLPSLAHTPDHVATTLAAMEGAMREVREAMEHGLAGRLDSPIGGHLESAAPRGAETTRGWKVARHSAYVTPADASATVESDGRRLAIVLAGAGRAGVRLAEPTPPRFRAAVRYRIAEWAPADAVVTIQLGATGADDPTWSGVRHSSGRGLPAWSGASFGALHRQQVCSYGHRAGRLILQHDGERMQAWHETDSLEPIGAPVALPRQPWWIAVQVEADRRVDRVAVEFDELELTEPA